MKKIFYIPTFIASLLLLAGCDTENELKTEILAAIETPTNPYNAMPGSADFSNYVAVGNSLTAGFMDGALYTTGQNNSYPQILANQMFFAGGGSFSQPDINSANGFNSSFSNVAAGVINGRTVLDTSIPGPVPLSGELIGTWTGDVTSLNNFGIPGARVVDLVSPLYGTPDLDGDGFPEGNPYYVRIASNPGTSTVLGDAASAGATFFSLWIGANDVLGWALSGGTAPDGEVTPGAEALSTATLTSQAAFTASYDAILGTLRAGGAKGVIANIPEVSLSPFFRAVPYNSIPLDAATAAALNDVTAFGGFNLALDGLAQAGAITQADADARKVVYAEGQNAVLITDDNLADLGPLLSTINPALAGFGQIRQIRSSELLLLTAATVLGTLADPNNPNSAFGVAVPLGDQYTLTDDEQATLSTRIALFNSIIAARATAGEVGVMDAHTIFLNIAVGGGFVADGLTLSPDFSPNGIFSTDGIHPNARGSAIIANSIIQTINATFGATLDEVSVTNFPGVNLL